MLELSSGLREQMRTQPIGGSFSRLDTTHGTPQLQGFYTLLKGLLEQLFITVYRTFPVHKWLSDNPVMVRLFSSKTSSLPNAFPQMTEDSVFQSHSQMPVNSREKAKHSQRST